MKRPDPRRWVPTPTTGPYAGRGRLWVCRSCRKTREADEEHNKHGRCYQCVDSDDEVFCGTDADGDGAEGEEEEEKEEVAGSRAGAEAVNAMGAAVGAAV